MATDKMGFPPSSTHHDKWDFSGGAQSFTSDRIFISVMREF